MKSASFFTRFSKRISQLVAHPAAFAAALGVVVVWGVSGPVVGWSDTWQLVINTGTTIITFLMVFLIQNTQNRDTAAIQIKLDELIRALEGAHNVLLDLEELDEKELECIREQYETLARKAREELTARARNGIPDAPDGVRNHGN
ncbi:MAG TPA: low affinity iron permease family protein [Thermodesulfobacteriota bacterium]|nr:low affinity iron permease family protein [Thermodesulfobacteriota bacterium]